MLTRAQPSSLPGRAATTAHACSETPRRPLTPARPRSPGQFPLPPIDPENVQFVVFVRAKTGLKRWNPLTVTQGNAQATLLVKGLDSDLTRDTTQSTLVKEFARAIYKDKEQVTKMVAALAKQAGPASGLKFAKEFEFGMGLLDRVNPRDSIALPGKVSPVWALPAEDGIEPTPAETVAAGATAVIEGISSGWKSFVDSTSAGLGGKKEPAAGAPAGS